jgi:hypothetical protein
MKIIVIAQATHAILGALAHALQAGSEVVAWEDTDEGYRQGLVAGVQNYVDNAELTPEQDHASWLEQKLADGWTYGEAPDVDAKLHPLVRPFAELSPEQRAKSILPHVVVHALKDIPDAEEAVEAALAKAYPFKPDAGSAEAATVATAMPVVQGQVPVKYIGRRDTFTDHLYGTGLVFEKGQVRNLPSELARKFLRHGDQFAENVAREGEQQIVQATEEPDQDDTAAKLADAQKLQELERDKESQLQDLKVQVNAMTKASLGQYALTNYQQKLDQSKTVAELRAQVIGMIDQFGMV